MMFNEMKQVMEFLSKFGLREVCCDAGQFFIFCGPKRGQEILDQMSEEDKRQMNELRIRYLHDVGLYHV